LRKAARRVRRLKWGDEFRESYTELREELPVQVTSAREATVLTALG